MPTSSLQYIVANPLVCHSKWIVQGTRILASCILEQLDSGMTREEIVKKWRGDGSLAAIDELARMDTIRSWFRSTSIAPPPASNSRFSAKPIPLKSTRATRKKQQHPSGPFARGSWPRPRCVEILPLPDEVPDFTEFAHSLERRRFRLIAVVDGECAHGALCEQ